jgi:hypothetical protein
MKKIHDFHEFDVENTKKMALNDGTDKTLMYFKFISENEFETPIFCPFRHFSAFFSIF